MDLTDLNKIGLTEGEIRVYSALLELGETTRTALAKKSGISPSKIYDVANRLFEKGIISVVQKNGVLHFSAADPNRLKDFLEQKEQQLQQEKELINDLLPSLRSKYHKTKEQVDIEVFYGWEGMKTVFDDMVNNLKKGDENLIFGASQGLDPAQADIFFSKYYSRQDKAGYATKVIFNENVRSNIQRTSYFTKSKVRKARFLYQDTFTEMNLYKDTVLFIMLLKRPIVIRVRSKEAADSFRKFFETMWHLAKP